jgi:hypothetical protein
MEQMTFISVPCSSRKPARKNDRVKREYSRANEYSRLIKFALGGDADE